MPRFDVTIAGELNLDLILYGLPAELPPERELLANKMTLTLGSSSAILAHNLALLGSRVGFQSKIGNDELGKIVLERLQRGGVDTSLVRQIPSGSGTGITVILQRDGWRNILTYSGTIGELTWNDLDLDYLTDSRHFHFSSYYLQSGLMPDVPRLFQRLKAAGLTISLDTNDDPLDRWEGGLREVLRYVDIFLPNAREAVRFAKTSNLDQAIEELAALVPLLVVKLGPDGAVGWRGKEQFSAPPVKVDVVDTVGAGDSFDAGFLHAYLRGSDLAACLRQGNLAGALSTTRPGGTASFLDVGHREEFFRKYCGADAGGKRA